MLCEIKLILESQLQHKSYNQLKNIVLITLGHISKHGNLSDESLRLLRKKKLLLLKKKLVKSDFSGFKAIIGNKIKLHWLLIESMQFCLNLIHN